MGALKSMWQRVKASRGEDRGASLVEYALLLGLIAVVCILAVTYLGQSASKGYSHYGDCVSKAGVTGADLSHCK